MSAEPPTTSTQATETLNVTLKFPDVNTFVDRFANFLERTRILLPGVAARPLGTALRFQLKLKDNTSLIGGSGQVEAIVTAGLIAGCPPGLLLRFEPNEDSRSLCDRILGARGGAPSPMLPPPSSSSNGADGASDAPVPQVLGSTPSGSVSTGPISAPFALSVETKVSGAAAVDPAAPRTIANPVVTKPWGAALPGSDRGLIKTTSDPTGAASPSRLTASVPGLGEKLGTGEKWSGEKSGPMTNSPAAVRGGLGVVGAGIPRPAVGSSTTLRSPTGPLPAPAVRASEPPTGSRADAPEPAAVESSMSEKITLRASLLPSLAKSVSPLGKAGEPPSAPVGGGRSSGGASAPTALGAQTPAAGISPKWPLPSPLMGKPFGSSPASPSLPSTAGLKGIGAARLREDKGAPAQADAKLPAASDASAPSSAAPNALPATAVPSLFGNRGPLRGPGRAPLAGKADPSPSPPSPTRESPAEAPSAATSPPTAPAPSLALDAPPFAASVTSATVAPLLPPPPIAAPISAPVSAPVSGPVLLSRPDAAAEPAGGSPSAPVSSPAALSPPVHSPSPPSISRDASDAGDGADALADPTATLSESALWSVGGASASSPSPAVGATFGASGLVAPAPIASRATAAARGLFNDDLTVAGLRPMSPQLARSAPTLEVLDGHDAGDSRPDPWADILDGGAEVSPVPPSPLRRPVLEFQPTSLLTELEPDTAAAPARAGGIGELRGAAALDDAAIGSASPLGPIPVASNARAGDSAAGRAGGGATTPTTTPAGPRGDGPPLPPPAPRTVPSVAAVRGAPQKQVVNAPTAGRVALVTAVVLSIAIALGVWLGAYLP